MVGGDGGLVPARMYSALAFIFAALARKAGPEFSSVGGRDLRNAARPSQTRAPGMGLGQIAAYYALNWLVR